MMTTKQNTDLHWFSRITWKYLFQPLFPESQVLCVENKHKSLLSEMLVEIVIFQQKKKLNTAAYSFLQTFCPLTQWYACLYETVITFRISTTPGYHFLKVFKLAWKSIL